MKRIYIAFACIAICIALCICEQVTINEVYNTSSKYIETASEYVNSKNYDKAYKICKNLDEYWNKKEPWLTAIIDHGSLDETSVTLNNLPDLAKSESDSLEEELITAKNQIKAIRDNQRITFGNIF